MENEGSSLNSFISTCSNICYVTSSSETMYQIPSVLGEKYCVLDLLNDNSPLKPFLELLRFYNPPFKNLESEVYELQLETFATYIHDGIAKDRQDLLIESETSYEQQCIKNSIIKLIELLNGENNYVFLNSQTLNSASLEIIERLESSQLKGKFVFCFDINAKEFNKRPLMGFIKNSCKKSNFLNGLKLPKFEGKDLPEVTENLDPEQLSTNLHNAVSFLDCETSKALATIAARNVKHFNLTKTQERYLYFEIASSFYINNSFDNACLFFNSIIDADISDDFDIRAKLLLSKIYLNRNMLSLAQKYAVLVIQNLSKEKKSPYYALALMYDYLSSKRDDSIKEAKYQQAAELLEKCDLHNNYVYCVLHFPLSYIEKNEKEQIFQNLIDKCDVIISQSKNLQASATLYHWKAILQTKLNDYDSAGKSLEMADKIRSLLGDIDSIITSKNGLSVHLMRNARFREAYNILNDVIDKVFYVKDFSCVLELLRNMSLAAFFFHDFEKAEKLVSILIDLHQDYVFEKALIHPFIPEINDLLIYQTILDIYNNDFIHAEINYNSLEKTSIDISETGKPYLDYINACILLKNNQLELAEQSFEKTTKAYENLKHYDFIIVFLFYEFSILLSRLGYNEKSRQYFSKGLELANKKSLIHFFKNKKGYTVESYIQDFKPLSDVKINLKLLQNKAASDYAISNLHNKITEYQFVNKINSYNYGISNIKTYLEKISQAICEYLMVQSVSFAELSPVKVWTNISSFAQNCLNEMPLPETVWENLYLQNKNYDSINLIYDENTELYYCDISRFNFICGIIIIPCDSQKISDHSLNIMNIVLSNIQSQLIMFRQNEDLADLVFTDPITSVNNSKSLMHHLTLESERIERMNKRNSQVVQKSIAFIDINNFKYYNERFGHTAGDFLLRSFAELLKKTLRRIDFICRYKDDEFVIVMSDTSNAEGERMCQRIYIELANSNFFIPELKKFLNQDFEIPQNKALTFSMGLCSNLDIEIPSNLTEVLRNASKALQYTKAHSKGSVSNWAKIKDTLKR